MQSLGYLCKPGDKPLIVPGEPQEVLDLSDSGGVGQFLIMLIFSLSVATTWMEMMCPR